MTIIVKLTAKQHCVIRADSSPDVPVNESVTIPENHYGTFYIRLCHGKKGVVVPESPFPAGWSGVPNITLVNNSGNDLYLRAGDEIGELHIRFNHPSPLSGSLMELPNIFAFGSKDGQMQVATSNGKLYHCEAIQCYANEKDIIRIDKGKEDWAIVETFLFSPVYQMINYNLVGILDCSTARELGIAFDENKLQGSLNKACALFKENDNVRENLFQQIAELNKVQHNENGDIFKQCTDIADHLHTFHTESINDQTSATQAPAEKAIESLILPNSFNVELAHGKIAASIKHVPIINFDSYSLVFGEELKGFVYDANDFIYSNKTLIKDILHENGKHSSKAQFLANQPIFDGFEEEVTLPHLTACKKLGTYAALIVANLDRIIKRDLNGTSYTLYRIFIFKAVIKIINKNIDTFVNGKMWIKKLYRCIQNDRQTYKMSFDPSTDYPYKDNLTTELKKADQSFHKPVELLDYLACSGSWCFITIIFGDKKPQPFESA